ncbi:MAG: glycosyltransferase family 4 protein [Candidatus Bathyarchaeia archaeon]
MVDHTTEGMKAPRTAFYHANFYDKGGSERVAIMQAHLLQGKGYPVTCYAPIVDKRRCFPEISQRLDIRPLLVTIPSPILKRTINRMLSFFTPIDRFKEYDISVCHNHPGPYLGYRIKHAFKKPYICFIHAPWRRLYPRPIDLETGWATDVRATLMETFPSLRWWKSIDMVSIRGADAILTNSEKIADEVEEIYGRGDAEVCYPAVEEYFRPLPPKATSYIVNKYRLTRPILLSTNRHAPQKRIDFLIRLMPNVLKTHPQATLVITGKPVMYYTKRLEGLAKELGVRKRAVFTRSVSEEDLISLYNEADLYLYAAVQEDFGFGPIEAGACGTPTIAWDDGGPSETILNGVTGHAVTPYDEQEYLEKTIRVLGDEGLRERMGLDAVRHVRENFTWRKHAETLERAIQRVIN